MNLRQKRIENEWGLLQQMAEANSSLLKIRERREDEFLLTLHETPAVLLQSVQPGDAGSIQLCSDHAVRLAFSRFFPAVPIEAYLACPVFHPNVHPETGFVCLWGRFSLHDTVVEALCQLQRVLTFTLFSESADHVMQPEALRWAHNKENELREQLHFTHLQKPAELKYEPWKKLTRKRLS